ncbi:MAG: hypothetical protein P8P36_02430 [Akkermansiaceae bacterium]|nr:hypothetical protein [Akkermansiaceae bacterium]
MLADLILKTDITIGPLAKILPVDPDFAVHVDGIKGNDCPLAGPALREFEGLPVPTDATGLVSPLPALSCILGVVRLKGPVMRHLQHPPTCIPVPNTFSPRRVTGREAPARIKVNHLTR